MRQGTGEIAGDVLVQRMVLRVLLLLAHLLAKSGDRLRRFGCSLRLCWLFWRRFTVLGSRLKRPRETFVGRNITLARG
jgi:hypothetical protein